MCIFIYSTCSHSAYNRLFFFLRQKNNKFLSAEDLKFSLVEYNKNESFFEGWMKIQKKFFARKECTRVFLLLFLHTHLILERPTTVFTADLGEPTLLGDIIFPLAFLEYEFIFEDDPIEKSVIDGGWIEL